jgi:8-oxo-dGTP diphosphatase
MRFVTGFLFGGKDEEVVLIEKNRPDFQRGRLNGVGGKVEEGETSVQAMEREFREETGVTVPADRWTHFVTVEGIHGGTIDMFFARDEKLYHDVETKTDERVYRIDLDTHWTLSLMPNIVWLVELALMVERKDHYSDGLSVTVFKVQETFGVKNV